MLGYFSLLHRHISEKKMCFILIYLRLMTLKIVDKDYRKLTG